MIRNFRFQLLCFAFVAFTTISSCKKDPIINPNEGTSDIEIGESIIPYLVINTGNKVILNEPKIEASLKIYESKVLTKTQKIGIEYKGKTSYRISNKKSYSLETWNETGGDINTSFFNLPEEEDWLLTGNVVNTNDKFAWDKTMLFNYLAYELSRSIGKYASRSKYVELEINGKYKGLYLFMEKLKRNKNRINVKSLDAASTNITGGYILTIDKSSIGNSGIGKPESYFDNNWDDDARYTSQNSFRSKYDINRNIITFPAYGLPYHPQQYLETYFLYEYPKESEISQEQKVYIQDYINSFETALLADDFNKGEHSYQNYIDVASFVDYFLLNELCRNVDAYRLSTYLQKERDGKLAMGPIWDMNIGFDEADRIPVNDWVINYNNYVSQDPWMMVFWWPRLMEDDSFKAEVKKRWQSLRSNEWSISNITKIIEDQVKYLQENGAIERNNDLWYKSLGVNYNQSVNDLKAFLISRSDWMDDEISKF